LTQRPHSAAVEWIQAEKEGFRHMPHRPNLRGQKFGGENQAAEMTSKDSDLPGGRGRGIRLAEGKRGRATS